MTAEKKPTDPRKVTPRQVADKSHPRALPLAIRMALEQQSGPVRLNTQKFNRQRYTATAGIEDYEELKHRARSIKERSIDGLESFIGKLREQVTSRGGFVYLAPDAASARDYIASVCLQHQAGLVVKSKSMTTEEIRLNPALENNGIEVVETDLAEFILQLSGEQPSHIVVPAVHRSRESISALFKESFRTDSKLDTGEDLTRFARDILREKFLSADVGISGANVIAADSGTIVLVESEGNIRMVCQAPPVHIAVAGVEKIVPARADLAPFIELLGPSGTGQPLTAYTQVIRPPLDLPAFSFGHPGKSPRREFHLVLVDNGRLRMRDDPELRQALYCIRCGACLNSCAVFQTVGGHAFGGETYSGGIGGAWEAGTGGLAKARFSQLCTGCSRCLPQCPVRIDIPWLNSVLQNRLARAKPADGGPGSRSRLVKLFFGSFASSAKWAARLGPLSGWAVRNAVSRLVLEKTVGFDRRRSMPSISGPFRDAGKEAEASDVKCDALLFADVYTWFTRPSAARAALAVLRAAGVVVTVSEVKAEGRAELSQGLLDAARQRARDTAACLVPHIGLGREVVVVEPSVLALFRHDYSNLLESRELFAALESHCFDSVEYLARLLRRRGIGPRELFDPEKAVGPGGAVFLHGHCQQKSVGAFEPTVSLLESLGLDVRTSDVECCGMAGSFGYKKDFYELSMKIGEDLFGQIGQPKEGAGQTTVLAAGVSCCEQISAGTGRDVLHPMELLERMLRG